MSKMTSRKSILKVIAMGIVFSLLICMSPRLYTVFADNEGDDVKASEEADTSNSTSDDEIKPLANGTVLMYEWKALLGSNINEELYILANSKESKHVLLTNMSKTKYLSNIASGDNIKLKNVNDASNEGECKVNSGYFITNSDLYTPVIMGSEADDEDFCYNIKGKGVVSIKQFRIGLYSKIHPETAANKMVKSGEDMELNEVKNDLGSVETNEEAAMYKSSTKHIGSTWSIAGGDILKKNGDSTYNISKESSSNVVKIWDTNEGIWERDFGIYLDGNEAKSHRDADWEDYHSLYIWVGNELEFSAISQDYVIKSNEVAVIDGSKSNALLMKGHKIIVEEGGVLNIKGIFLNNGYIECRGGTIILQENSVMAPYNSAECPATTVTDLNCGDGNGILNINGGEFFIMSNAILATDSLHYNAIRVKSDNNKRMGKIVNYGSIIAPSIYVMNGLIYNKTSGSILLGTTFDNGIALRNSKINVSDGKISSTYTTDSSKGKTFVIMNGNSSSVVVNDGKLKYQSTILGVKVTGEGETFR